MVVRKQVYTEGRGIPLEVAGKEQFLELFSVAQKGAEKVILFTSFLIETAFYCRSHSSQAQGFME